MSGENDAAVKEESLRERITHVQLLLEDLEEERRFTLGQTGVHLGAGRVDYLRRSWASEEARLRAELAALEAQLAAEGGDGHERE